MIDGCSSPSSPHEIFLENYPLVMTNIAIEKGHKNSGFTHEKWWFSIVMLVYQRVMNCYGFDQL